jgi:hypothetical protein
MEPGDASPCAAPSRISVGSRLARRLLWIRTRANTNDEGEHDMNRMNAVALGLAAVLMTTAANAAPPPLDEVQAPRGQEDVQAPRSQDDVQAPRGQDQTQAPRGQDDVNAPRT